MHAKLYSSEISFDIGLPGASEFDCLPGYRTQYSNYSNGCSTFDLVLKHTLKSQLLFSCNYYSSKNSVPLFFGTPLQRIINIIIHDYYYF